MKRTLFIPVTVILVILLLSGCRGGMTEGGSGESTTAFVRVNLVPMTAEVVFADQTVLVEGDRIVAMGDSSEMKIPRGATILDGKGAYLMPGLADMHVHIYEESRDEYPVSPFSLYVAKGVTTIRDCGTAPLSPSGTFILDWRDEILRGDIIGPIIYSSGRTIHGPVANPGRIVRQRHTDGFDFVKLYMELSIQEFEEAQAVAEELGMFTVGHIPYQVGFDQAVAAGLDEIAHVEELSFELMWSDGRPTRTLSMDQWLSSIVGEAYETFGYEPGSDFVFDSDEFHSIQGYRLDQIISGLISNDIPVGTTLATYEVVDQKLFAQDVFFDRGVNVYLPAELIEEVRNGQNRHQLVLRALGENTAAWFWKRDLDIYVLQKLHEAGVLLVSGTDAGSTSIGVVEGFATHDDLRLLTEYGFTPYEALQTATVNAAYVVEKMTGENDFGSIEIGKRADLILIGGNPLDDINNTQDILGVMARGHWYPAEELETMIAIGD